MSDEKKEVVDTYWEHELHDKSDKNCSMCFNEKNIMEYKVTIVVERSDEAQIEREYLHKNSIDYTSEVEDIISSLEAEI